LSTPYPPSVGGQRNSYAPSSNFTLASRNQQQPPMQLLTTWRSPTNFCPTPSIVP
ncbi:hypothetical protein FRC06_009753, partial [Ceratobasidium sp. 370]